MTELRALVVLQRMYKEINDEWLKIQRYCGTTKWTDPYRIDLWPPTMELRFREAAYSLGLEFLAVAMHADIFASIMCNDTDENWEALRLKVECNKYSLRMFVLMRRVQYAWFYHRSRFAKDLGTFIPYPLYSEPNLPHPHEVYLTISGDIRRCDFTNEGTRATKPIIDISENIYEEKEFIRAGRPSTWPKKWPYPFHPQYNAESEDEPFSRCSYCDKAVVPSMAFHRIYRSVNNMCKCEKSDWLSDAIVEIIEYPAYGTSGLNRGVRALSDMKKNETIGEYLGTFIPLQFQHLSGDDWYTMDFDGPFDPKSNDYEPRTSLLASGLQGGWTRFMNDAHPKKTSDAQFYPEVVGGKQRTVVQTKRGVKFGTEIKTSYGSDYFQSESQEEARQKAERERLFLERRASDRHNLRSKAMGLPYPPPNPPSTAQGGRLVASAPAPRRKRR